MSSIILNQVMVGDRPMVRYLMKQKGGNVEGKTSPKSAMWMLTNDKAKVPHMTDEFSGFPLTADGVYFFDGALAVSESEGDEGALSPAGAGTSPSADGEAKNVAPVCGPDYCEIPEVAEKPKKSRKKAKDVVCK